MDTLAAILKQYDEQAKHVSQAPSKHFRSVREVKLFNVRRFLVRALDIDTQLDEIEAKYDI